MFNPPVDVAAACSQLETSPTWLCRTGMGVYGPVSLADLRRVLEMAGGETVLAWRLGGSESDAALLSVLLQQHPSAPGAAAGGSEAAGRTAHALPSAALTTRTARPMKATARARVIKPPKAAPDGGDSFIGVFWHKPAACWKAQLRFAGKNVSVGRFAEKAEAAKQFDRCVIVVARLSGGSSLRAAPSTS